MGLSLGIGLALIGGPLLDGGALAAPSKASTFDVRTQITWDPSGRVWAGALTPERCSARMIHTVDTAHRTAAFLRRGEMVAEFRAPRPLTPVAIAGAQACAVEAAGSVGTSALLSSAEAPFQAFRGAFAACLVRQGSAGQLGGMRLWIDTSCDW